MRPVVHPELPYALLRNSNMTDTGIEPFWCPSLWALVYAYRATQPPSPVGMFVQLHDRLSYLSELKVSESLLPV